MEHVSILRSLTVKVWPAVVLLLLFVMAACGVEDEAAVDEPDADVEEVDDPEVDVDEADGEPIVIGMTNALTGPFSEFGQAGLKSVELAIDQWNEAGGINGRPLELVTYDDQLEADRAQTNMQRLLEEDEVDVIIGPSGSGPTLAVVDLVQAHDRVMMNSIAQTVEITYPDGVDDPPRPNLFNFALQNDVEATFLAEKVGQFFEAPGLIGESTPYGATGVELIAEILREEHGIEPVGIEEYDQRDTDMTAQLARLDRAGADAIVLVGLGADAATLRAGMASLGLEMPLVGSMGVPTGPYHELAGPELVDGTVVVLFDAFAVWGDDVRPEAEEVADAWFEGYGNDAFYGPGEDPGEYFGHTMGWYDATVVLFQAIERAGSTDRAAVQEALESGDVFSASRADYTFSPERHHAVTSDELGLFQYYMEDGEIAVREFEG